MAELPKTSELLAAAVTAVGGTHRSGQQRMSEAVDAAIANEEHLVVQAGTGTGKSLAYLVPAIRHAVANNQTVVVSTATIALQRQLIERDLPRVCAALQPELGREPSFAILKGRGNYLCLQRLNAAPGEDPEAELFDPRMLSHIGQQVQRLHSWAEDTATGDRDELVPGVSDRAWRQVSVTSQECLGASACPYGDDCYAEQARVEASGVDVVVTNHALLAIDAANGFQLLPDHSLLVVDEAHELVDRVTSVSTGVLSERSVTIAANRAGRVCAEMTARRLGEAAEGLGVILAEEETGRMDQISDALASAVAAVRDAAASCAGECSSREHEVDEDQDPDDADSTDPESRESGSSPERRRALAACEEVRDTAARLLASFESTIRERTEVVWLDRGERQTPGLRVAPLAVREMLRDRLFGDRRTVVLTSATLALGGSFGPLASQWGLAAGGAEVEGGVASTAVGSPTDTTTAGEPEGEAPPAHPQSPTDTGDPEPRWQGLDVGSPFDHARSGILYVARHLPTPGRDGPDPRYLTELAELIEAAGGRTLALFSSTRAATQAAEELRERLTHPILCQGEDSTAELVRQFAAEARSCLFGTLSLWQGVDVPGPSLQLVVVDRIPFPRPDDPLASARQRAVGAHGGNGFMEVAATHAALLLAQGTGRLLRSVEDRGVIAVLDSRLATARYGAFLRASLPPYWATTDPQVARDALRRLDESATDER
ncbi:ATP-dependent DNA helicase [Lipingzhangella sp. LS1_29]|uniref:DNA 5'-3' helicase n=1 Tax=Lipingzhangella rawalii TaxID=2055835 RepID=A0ABU2H963_9ACTN|nr:ATP-dependent DNA helicase [Lipingzhangella rawalii]MDS1271144.1 ATP-dependent DNA helicase [Lipingzhangella rawalii]